jgi:hypothetical protein
MAKSSLPSVDDYKGPTVRKPTELPAPPPESEGHLSRQVYVKNMTRLQAKNLRDDLRSLQDSGAKTKDGRFITNKSQAIKYMLENKRLDN